MSVFRRLFGLETYEQARARAEGLFEGGEWGVAKLAFEKARDKAPSEQARSELDERIRACLDGVARQRIEEGKRQRDGGNLDLARQELEGALEVAVSGEVRGEAQGLLDALERHDATEAAPIEQEVTDEERLAVIAGSWEEPQAIEYEGYGERFERALLALHDEQEAHARDELEALLEEAPEPRYLYLEVARARLRTSDEAGGRAALRAFLDQLSDDEGGDARLAAHVELARLEDERGDFESAVAEYEAAIEALGEDPRPYLWLGVFLRHKEHAEEAVEVIQSAMELMDQARPDWRVLQELGLAQAEAGHDAAAIETLEQVIEVLTGRQHYDLPPATATRLAELHEQRGNLERAADLYRALTEGSDGDNLPAYHRKAAGLLERLGMDDEAHRLGQRADALEAKSRPAEDPEEAGSDAEAR